MPNFKSTADTMSFSPKALHDLAKLLYPKGYHSGNFINIQVDDRRYELRFAMHRGPFVVVMLHKPGTDYARFNADLQPTGEVVMPAGVIPKHDLRPSERPLPADSVYILTLVYQRLLELQKQRQRRKK